MVVCAGEKQAHRGRRSKKNSKPPLLDPCHAPAKREELSRAKAHFHTQKPRFSSRSQERENSGFFFSLGYASHFALIASSGDAMSWQVACSRSRLHTNQQQKTTSPSQHLTMRFSLGAVLLFLCVSFTCVSVHAYYSDRVLLTGWLVTHFALGRRLALVFLTSLARTLACSLSFLLSLTTLVFSLHVVCVCVWLFVCMCVSPGNDVFLSSCWFMLCLFGRYWSAHLLSGHDDHWTTQRSCSTAYLCGWKCQWSDSAPGGAVSQHGPRWIWFVVWV
jgi:hypothetical protein